MAASGVRRGKGGAFPGGASSTRQPLQPEAAGAADIIPRHQRDGSGTVPLTPPFQQYNVVIDPQRNEPGVPGAGMWRFTISTSTGLKQVDNSLSVSMRWLLDAVMIELPLEEP
jgi:hypothetical protein